jgi:HAD superfamily hydrolase (TIGR01509 family)
MQMKIPKKNIKAVFFDLDGVLIDSYSCWFVLFNKALEHFGFKPIDKKTFRRYWGKSTEEDVRTFMPGKGVDDVRAYFQSRFPEYISQLVKDPDAVNLLHRLKQDRLKTACLTNSHEDITKQILEYHDLNKYFDIIITADNVKRPKPAPDMVITACQKLKIMPEQAVFLGDTQSDKQAARTAGCRFIGYKLKSSVTVNSLSEFYDLLST